MPPAVRRLKVCYAYNIYAHLSRLPRAATVVCRTTRFKVNKTRYLFVCTVVIRAYFGAASVRQLAAEDYSHFIKCKFRSQLHYYYPFLLSLFSSSLCAFVVVTACALLPSLWQFVAYFRGFVHRFEVAYLHKLLCGTQKPCVEMFKCCVTTEFNINVISLNNCAPLDLEIWKCSGFNTVQTARVS